MLARGGRKVDRTFRLHLEEALDGIRHFEARRLRWKTVPDRLLEELGRASVSQQFLEGIRRYAAEHLYRATARISVPADKDQQIGAVMRGG